MEQITVSEIKKESNTVRFIFSVTDGLKRFFSGKPFVIEYQEDIATVPDSVLAIPFVCGVLPIVWITGCKLRLEELDFSFYNCLPNLKNGYRTMFPETDFTGEIDVKHIVENHSPEKTNSCAMFYSGGVDSCQTFISHCKEHPSLLSIWGSDIEFENAEGWELVHRGISDTAEKYNLPDIVIHSTFREFDNEGALDAAFHSQLKDGWWHGVKHGIALLGHVAPLAYLHNYTVMYIASTHCPQDGAVRCASNPLTDNCVRFVDCEVVHDGYRYSRQDKIHNIVESVKTTGINIPLHVCWESQEGTNCCRCEKCYRTMAGLAAEGADPAEYGFVSASQTLGQMRDYIFRYEIDNHNLTEYWPYAQKAVQLNKDKLSQLPYYGDIRWILDFDFQHPRDNYEYIAFQKQQRRKRPLKQRLTERFPGLYDIYRKMRG